MQFLCCKVHFLMIYAHMSASWLGSILRFSDFEILNFEIVGLNYMYMCCTHNMVDPPPNPAIDPNIWIRHATLLPKKEKSLNTPAPPPRPRRETASLGERRRAR